MLSEISPVLASAKLFLSEEPLRVKSILVTLSAEAPSVDHVLVYNDDRVLLGRARLDPSAPSNRTYTLTLPSDTFMAEQREERKIYVRAQVKPKDQGGLSNETVQVSTISIQGFGEWSNRSYTQATAEPFLAFKTARSKIVSVQNAGQTTGPLSFGAQRVLGSFLFTGKTTDSTAHTDITQLTFRIGQTGGVGLTNVKLGADASNEKYDCTVSATLVTCASIPEPYGTLTDGPRTLTLYGDVSLTEGSTNASLRLSLVEPGSINEAGSVSWYDGTTTFTWVAADGSVAEGTYYTY